jgi:SOS response regulatory protein OraA/RecX
MARYPQIRVSFDSANPVALVARIRLELRRAGVDRREIQKFSGEALARNDPQRIRKVCSEWVGVRTTP